MEQKIQWKSRGTETVQLSLCVCACACVYVQHKNESRTCLEQHEGE